MSTTTPNSIKSRKFYGKTTVHNRMTPKDKRHFIRRSPYRPGEVLESHVGVEEDSSTFKLAYPSTKGKERQHHHNRNPYQQAGETSESANLSDAHEEEDSSDCYSRPRIDQSVRKAQSPPKCDPRRRTMPLENVSASENDAKEGSSILIQLVLALGKNQLKIIDKILEGQQEIKREVEKVRQEIESLKAEKSQGLGNKSRLIQRELTNRICSLHGAQEQNFNPEESSMSHHNQLVTSTIIKEIMDDPDNVFPIKTVTLGVKRKYESERRHVKDVSGDQKMKRTKKSKYDQRKQRTYLKRKSVLTEREVLF